MCGAASSGMAPFVLLCSAFLVLLRGGIAAGAADDLFLESRPQMIFQFGDSLSDTGNAVTAFPLEVTVHATDRPPYGSTFFHHATGRNSDGRLIIDFLAEGLDVPLLEPSLQSSSENGLRYAHGANFATCGASALSLDFYRMRNFSLSFPTFALDSQFQFFVDFKKQYALKQDDVASRSVFIVGEIGGDDYEIMLVNGLSYAQMHRYVPLVVQAIVEHIRRLYSEGARQFIVVNVPLQGCSAGHLALARVDDKRDRLGCLAGLNSVNSHHNLHLHAEVRRLREELAGASIFYADFAAVYASILRNASEYGFDYPFKACCGTYTNSSVTTLHCGEIKAADKDNLLIVGEACVDPQRYILWNDGHYTEHFHYTVADAFMFSDLYVHPPISSWFKRRLQRSSA